MKDLYSFLNESNSYFRAELSRRGGYITFQNSGRRGGIKSFQIGLDNILQTLKDILDNIDVFRPLTKYVEKQWRDNGSTYFKDPVANANSTVQTKPLFSTLSKIIIWGNQPKLNNINPDENIVIEEDALSRTIVLLEKVANSFTPKSPLEFRKSEKRKESHQQIYYGAPGTGKSHIVKMLTAGEQVVRTTFHPDSDYSTFVGSYKPTTKQVPIYSTYGEKAVPIKDKDGNVMTEDRIVYEFVAQAFLQSYINAWKLYAAAGTDSEPQRQYLIIEEINRGNCAQIFGDLFQLLDRNHAGFSDYPIKADKDMQMQLAKAFRGLKIEQAGLINACYDGEDVVSRVVAGEILLLPDNLYVWATMNTSDQSLFPIDSAFKRRWDWQYMPIAKGHNIDGSEMDWRIAADDKQFDWWSFLTKINEQIGEATHSEDKKLGFFFCKAGDDGLISAATFVGKVVFYLWNDVFKDSGLDSLIFTDSDGSVLSFNKFYTTDANGYTVVQKNTLQRFLENLGVEVVGESGDSDFVDENGNSTDPSKPKDFSRYSINGVGNYSKGGVVYEVIRLYVLNNPEKSTQQIIDNWRGLRINIPNLIETQEEHDARKEQSKDSRFEEKSKRIDLSSGDIVYVSNQYTPNRINDFITKVNAQNWGLRIEKVE